MITRIIEGSIHYRVPIIVLALVLAVVGIWSVKHIAVDAIPDLSDTQVIVKVSYPGQAPAVVQDQVTFPLTSTLLAVPKATTVRGYSYFGDSLIYVLFEDGTDPYWARSRVLETLAESSELLPEGVTPKLGPDATGVGWVYIYALTSSGRHNLADLREIQDTFLRYELQSLPGVAEVASAGGMVRQYQIQLDPTQLTAFDLSLSKVISSIRMSNSEVGAAVVEQADAEYMIRTLGYIKSPDDLSSVFITMMADGRPVLLSDIATVVESPVIRRGVIDLDGKGEVVAGIIVMRQGENAQSTINLVKRKLHELSKSLPDDIDIVSVYDRSKLIDGAVQHLTDKLVEELILVVLVCAAFLFHIRSALVIAITLPIAVLIAFIIMRWQGINANIMSLGGIAIAIGAMVDGAIVMIENVHKHRSQYPNLDRWTLVRQSCKEVGPGLFASLAIITISFLPIFALEAQEGKLFMPLAYTKTYAMAAAAILAITLVPVVIGYCLSGRVRAQHANPINRVMLALYRPVLQWSLKHPIIVLVAACLILSSIFLPSRQLGSEFMPELDEGDWMYMPTTLPGISVAEARFLLQRTDQIIASVPEVDRVLGKVGRADTATDPAPLTMIETFIQLKPRSQWRPGMTPRKLKILLEESIDFPGLSNAWVMPIQTRIDMLSTGIKTPLGIKVAGDDLDEIQHVSQQLEALIGDVNGVTSVYAERPLEGRYIIVDIDRQAAAVNGLTVAEINQWLSHAVGGKPITESVQGRVRVPVSIRLPPGYRDSLAALRNMFIQTDSGRLVTLGSVADVQVSTGPAMIKSENAQLNAWLFIDTAHRNFQQTVKEIEQRIESARNQLNDPLVIPAGITWRWAGQFEQIERVKDRLILIIPLVMLSIVLFLFMAFKNWTSVWIILLTLPFALIGAVWLLWFLEFQWSIAVVVGMIALAGVAVEIGVIMMLYLNQGLHKRTGALMSAEATMITNRNDLSGINIDDNQAKDRDKYQAMDQASIHMTNQINDLRHYVIQVSEQRLRPILMTVSTIAIGLMPVMYSDGIGSEVMSRIAAPMVGGTLTALVLTLVVLPVVFFEWKSFEIKQQYGRSRN